MVAFVYNEVTALRERSQYQLFPCILVSQKLVSICFAVSSEEELWPGQRAEAQ